MSTGTLSLQLLCGIALLEEGKASRLFVLDQTSKTSLLMGTKATRISRDSKSVSVKIAHFNDFDNARIQIHSRIS